MKIIHLTDTHFVPRGKTLYGRAPSTALAAAIADINTHHADAALAIVTGDLTHWGEADAFEHLSEVLAPLKPPLRLLIGNHDDRETFRRFFPDQPCDAAGFVQSTLEVDAGRFLFLDTVLAGTHAGHYCEQRLAWLAAAIDGPANEALFLFMHHPPFDVGLRSLDLIGLVEKDAFREIVRPHRARIRHLFFGHVHRPIGGSWMGIPVSSLRAMNHQVWLDMEAEQHRGSFEPPAYAVVLIEHESILVHSHDFMDTSPKFKLADSPWDDWATRYAHP